MPLDQVDVDKYEWDAASGKLDQAKDMSLFEHLEELRWHIIRALLGIVIGAVVLFLFEDWYFKTILLGPTNEDFISYRWFCNISSAICFTPPEFQTIATGFAETFITSIKMCFVGGFVIAFPWVFYQIWSFIRPGLYKEERRITRGVVFICSLLFLLGVLFGFFIIAPFAVNFLGSYTIPTVVNSPTLQSVINYMVMFTLPAGLIFELPIVVYFLARIGLVSAKDMRTYRRHSIIGILLLAAILTPPDVVTQFLIGIPLFILYEVSILVALRAERQYQKDL